MNAGLRLYCPGCGPGLPLSPAALPAACLVLILTAVTPTLPGQDLPESEPAIPAAMDDIFLARDSDANGELSLMEVLRDLEAEHHPTATRDFHVIDWNGDGALSAVEYTSWPDRGAPWKRQQIPDPYQQRAEEAIRVIESRWSKWDSNADEMLDSSEFTAAMLTELVPGVAQVPLATWDQDASQSLSREEARRVVRIALGLETAEGDPLRWPNGMLFNLRNFRGYDQSKDGLVDAAECAARRQISADEAIALIARSDQNNDQQLTLREALPICQRDPLKEFLSADTNLNGRLSVEEVLASCLPQEQALARQLWPGFDENQDGELSFVEYRSSPLGTSDEVWYQPRDDANQDGQLSWDEFAWDHPLQSRAIAATIFARLDLSGDGVLDLSEFAFRTSQRDPALVFTGIDRDRDGRLSLPELERFTGDPRRAGRDGRLFDFDASGELSKTEYFSIPGAVAVEHRVGTPDPIADLAAEQIQQLTRQWSGWDVNGDGGLSAKEFATAGLAAQVPGLSTANFATWDQNHNAALSLQEAERVVRVAYGLELENGLPMHRTDGRVFTLKNFSSADINHDGVIDVEEQAARQKVSQEEAAMFVARFDRDGDQRLSAEEAAAYLIRDPVREFVNADANFDGELSPEELRAMCQPYEQQLAARLFPAFDVDGDGLLSLLEFRGSPLGVHDELWHLPRTDVDEDGRLSPAEFDWGRALQSRSVAALMFRRLDLSRDGFLDPSEYDFHSKFASPQQKFEQSDKDHDQALTFDEFAREQRESPRVKREFQVFDFDADGRLTWEEYRGVPARNAVHLRELAIDPIGVLAAQSRAQLAVVFRSADKNGDERLDTGEFGDGRVCHDVAGLELSTFADWDLDGNQQLTTDEVGTAVDRAWGIVAVEGHPLRRSSGATVNYGQFPRFDADGDGVVSRSEFTSSPASGKKAEELFAQSDANQDGRLNLGEYCQGTAGLFDPVVEFLRVDADFDGRLSATELKTGLPEWQHPISRHYLPAFDDDRSGDLSLSEYLLTPLTNRYRLWLEGRNDQDGDGSMSLSEFCGPTDVPLRCLAAEYFRRFDQNQDGRLSLQEFSFHMDVEIAPVPVVFAYRDANADGALTQEELLGPERSRTGEAAQKRLARLETLFLDSDANVDGRLTPRELTSGKQASEQNQRRGVRSSTEVKRNAEQPVDYRMIGIIAFNVLLVGAIGWYVLKRT